MARTATNGPPLSQNILLSERQDIVDCGKARAIAFCVRRHYMAGQLPSLVDQLSSGNGKRAVELRIADLAALLLLKRGPTLLVLFGRFYRKVGAKVSGRPCLLFPTRRCPQRYEILHTNTQGRSFL